MKNHKRVKLSINISDYHGQFDILAAAIRLMDHKSLPAIDSSWLSHDESISVHKRRNFSIIISYLSEVGILCRNEVKEKFDPHDIDTYQTARFVLAYILGGVSGILMRHKDFRYMSDLYSIDVDVKDCRGDGERILEAEVHIHYAVNN